METLTKTERICSKKVIGSLFAGGSLSKEPDKKTVSSMAVYPLRAVYQLSDSHDAAVPVEMMVSVSKRKFHHAVDRNRMKRLVREAYRRNKDKIWAAAQETGIIVRVAFVCMADSLCTQAQIDNSVRKILYRIKERSLHASSDMTE